MRPLSIILSSSSSYYSYEVSRKGNSVYGTIGTCASHRRYVEFLRWGFMGAVVRGVGDGEVVRRAEEGEGGELAFWRGGRACVIVRGGGMGVGAVRRAGMAIVERWESEPWGC